MKDRASVERCKNKKKCKKVFAMAQTNRGLSKYALGLPSAQNNKDPLFQNIFFLLLIFSLGSIIDISNA